MYPLPRETMAFLVEKEMFHENLRFAEHFLTIYQNINRKPET